MGDSVHVWLAPAGAEPRLSAHDLLLALASTLVTGPVLSHDPTGRPHIPGLAVSISHTHHLLAVAASYDGPLGVDVEEVYSREVRALADRWFHPDELAWMADQSDELAAFLHLWTAKEAVGKALGAGLRNAGLRRRMPLPGSPAVPIPTGQARRGVESEKAAPAGVALRAGLVTGEAGLAVLHVSAEQAILGAALAHQAAPEAAAGAEQAILAVALPSAAAEVVVTVHHETALRRVVRSRTSFPVIVRGG